MAQQRFRTTNSVSPLLVTVGSLVLIAHFGALAVRLLAAPSGPWFGPEGESMADPPAFAQGLDEPAQGYLKLLRLTRNDRMPGNNPAAPGVRLEIRLKDAKGEVFKTLKFPESDPNDHSWVHDNSWVRHRQELFAQELVPDRRVAPLQGEAIPAPNQSVKLVYIWDVKSDDSLQLVQVPEHLIPRNRGEGVFGPTRWSLVLVRSLARHLCRAHGAASAEVIRFSRNPIHPSAFLMGGPPPAAFADLIASYGEMSRE
jgi:hypothetical protein